MQTYSVNALAMQFEVDRATMQRALKNTPPDLAKGKRQSFKISTAIRALEVHRRNAGTSIPGNGSKQQRLALIEQEEATFAELDRQFARLEAEPDIEKRRKLSFEMKIGMTINKL